MRILLTNDDGINAEGLKILVNWAKKLGEVFVFAPKNEQSGKGQSIEIHKGFECKKVDVFGQDVLAYSVDSTPADCVRVAILGFKLKIDLVISGVNRGVNLGGDIMYSGTVGACFEAAHLGLKALAFSTDYKSFENVYPNIDRVYQFIESHEMFDLTNIVNVNFPLVGDEIKVTKIGAAIYSDDFIYENDIITPNLICNYKGTCDLTIDTDAVMCGYISISPVDVQLTNSDAFNQLTK